MFIIHLIFSALAIMLASYVVPGVILTGFWSALLVALALGLVNIFVRPILFVLTLPINIITLGLFSFVLNALLIMFVSAIVPGFKVSGFLTALIFSLVLSVINMIFGYFSHHRS